MSTYCSVATSWRISSIGNNGARSSSPTGCPVPGCSTGGGGVGRSCSTLYQRVGISLSSSWNLCCFACDMALPNVRRTGDPTLVTRCGQRTPSAELGEPRQRRTHVCLHPADRVLQRLGPREVPRDRS